jgi:hypothetical protein
MDNPIDGMQSRIRELEKKKNIAAKPDMEDAETEIEYGKFTDDMYA